MTTSSNVDNIGTAVLALREKISKARGVDGAEGLSNRVLTQIAIVMGGEKVNAVVADMNYNRNSPKGRVIILGERLVYDAVIQDLPMMGGGIEDPNSQWSAKITICPRTALHRVEVQVENAFAGHGVAATLNSETKVLLDYEGIEGGPVEVTRRNTESVEILLTLVREDL